MIQKTGSNRLALALVLLPITLLLIGLLTGTVAWFFLKMLRISRAMGQPWVSPKSATRICVGSSFPAAPIEETMGIPFSLQVAIRCALAVMLSIQSTTKS